MERQDPYIGTGTPPPIVERRREGPGRALVIVALVLLAIGAAAYFFLRREPPPPPPPPQAIPAPAPLPLAQAPRHPVESEPAQPPLPALNASDGPVAAALSSLIGLDAFGHTFLTENLVRNIVATVDNLPREQVSQRVNPIQPVPRIPVIVGTGAGLTLAPANSARYAAYVKVMDGIATKDLVAFYRRHYPLFQQAYVDLGYPNGYFNDRLVEVIDHLLATPEPAGPLRLRQPKVLYEFADPALEELSAGQKTMLRIGKDNRERVKAKLREIRAAITAG
jgi:hypothetical protein